MNSKEFKKALDNIVKEKGIDPEVVYSAMELALTSAYKKNFNSKKLKEHVNNIQEDIDVKKLVTPTVEQQDSLGDLSIADPDGNVIVRFENGHIKGAINIPLSELREKANEIPKDKPVYLHCRTGQRSYNAALALQHLGYDNVVNVTGSFLGLSFYEAYNDKLKNRESIVTNYNFK